MKLSLTQENFARALSNVSKSVSTKPSIPVLSNVLLEIKDNRLYISGTDLEFGITESIGADVQKGGSTTVSARTITEFVNSLAPGKLDIELRDTTLTVSNENSSSAFNTIPTDEFPPIPEAKGDVLFQIKGDVLADSIEKVVTAIARDDSRPVLTGVLFECIKGELSLVGVDGFRLSKKVITIKKAPKEDIHYIVPGKSLEEFGRIILSSDEANSLVDVLLLNDKNQLMFRFNDVTLSTRLIEGEFPDYEQILPKDNSISVKMSKEDFFDAIKIVNIFARSAIGNKCMFQIEGKKKKLALSASVDEVGENKSELSVNDAPEENFASAYNTRFLTDMIGVIDGDELVFETNGPTAPGVFKDSNDESFLHIIMPMRLE